MDVRKEKKAWYWRYRFYIVLAAFIFTLLTYMVIILVGPARMRIESKLVEITEANESNFLEYVDVEGVVQPFKIVKINALESGFVKRIIAEDGAILEKGDTILILENPDLIRTISDEEDEYLRQQRLLKEQEIEISQKSLASRQQTLDVNFEASQLDDKLRIAQEEFAMGMKSKAEIDLAEREYKYHKDKVNLQRRNLTNDSVTTALRRELLQVDLEQARTKKERAIARKENLVVRAPIGGQLSYLTVTAGEQVPAGANIGEIKGLNDFKLHVSLNEYYVDRVTSGLPGTISNQSGKYPLKVARVIPEIKDRYFNADLIFTDTLPPNLRVGKSYRVMIELGQSEQALIIPNGDFYNSTGGKWIYKVIGGRRAVKTQIVLGRKNPTQYEVLSGLKPGDKVIVNGYDHFDNKEEIILQ